MVDLGVQALQAVIPSTSVNSFVTQPSSSYYSKRSILKNRFFFMFNNGNLESRITLGELRRVDAVMRRMPSALL